MSADEHFASALGDICAGYPALKPPKRVTVSQGASENLVIKQPGAAGGAWSGDETPYMIEPMNMLASRRHESLVFVGPARTGKCLDLETPIPTPLGWVRMGDLKTGDQVFGSDGLPTRISAAHEVKTGLKCYSVKFSDGSELISDAEHLWEVQRFYRHAPQWRSCVVATSDMLEDFKCGSRRKYRVKNTEPIELPDADLPIDPYLLGLWLANGSSGSTDITCHVEDSDHYVSEIQKTGFEVKANPIASTNAVRVFVDKGVQGVKCKAGSFRALLIEHGLLNNKHIPNAYIFASKNQRLSLLKGLLDGDGHVPLNRSVAIFSQVNRGLFDDVLILCRSLGFAPTTLTFPAGKGVAHRLEFRLFGDLVPFGMKRKIDRISNKDNFRSPNYRYIEDIREVESRPVRCIAVENESKLFLAGTGMVPTHNTAGLLLGWLAHAIVNDPGDFCMIQMTKEKAREFSKTDVDRAIKHSPNIYNLKSTRAIDSNTFDSMFRNGMFLRIAWPTVSNVSGSTYRYVAITDLDRIANAENVDGEGPLFDLARKRTTTFQSRGMCLAESSPGIEIDTPDWRPATPHEAPPVKGILGLYNRSDRRRWYWRCPDCHEGFEAAPGMGLFNLPSEAELLESVRSMSIPKMAAEWGSRVICPHCGSLIGAKHKQHLNRTGRWLAEGQIIDVDGNVIGEPPPATIAGYWLGGVAATYQKWQSLVERYLQGLADYALTGGEETLKTTVNTDQGMPYISRHLAEASTTKGNVEDRADASLQRYVAPAETRCLLASVDVQGGVNARFVVQVHAVGPHMEQWLVDRHEIRDSMRDGVSGGFAPIDPASHPEDWDVLTEKLLRATWRTPLEGREIMLKMLTVDSGGEDGVTHNAYAWWRRLRAEKLHHRVMLYKGASEPKAPILRESMVGKRGGKTKPDVPLYQCNPNLLSDAVDSGLRRDTPGPGYIHFPPPKHPQKNPTGWLSSSFFDELKSEVRLPSGVWSQIRKRNESFDLCRMIRAAMLKLGIDKVDWNRVPAWLAPLEQNSLVITVEERREMKENERIPDAVPVEVQVLRPRVKKQRRSALPTFLR